MATKPKSFTGTQEEWDNYMKEYEESNSENKKESTEKFTESEEYKNADSDTKRIIDDLIINGNVEKVKSLFGNISSGNAANLKEAIEYNNAIDETQLGIDQFADKSRMALQAANIVDKESRLGKIGRESDELVDKNTQDILNNVAPQIKRSQALSNALGQAAYNASAGIPTEVVGAMNSQGNIAYANALDHARGLSNQSNYNSALFSAGLQQARQNAALQADYAQKAQGQYGALAAQDQNINNQQAQLDAANNAYKQQFRAGQVQTGQNRQDSVNSSIDALRDTYSYVAPNAIKKAMEISALNKLRNPAQTAQTAAAQASIPVNNISNAARAGINAANVAKSISTPNVPNMNNVINNYNNQPLTPIPYQTQWNLEEMQNNWTPKFNNNSVLDFMEMEKRYTG